MLDKLVAQTGGANKTGLAGQAFTDRRSLLAAMKRKSGSQRVASAKPVDLKRGFVLDYSTINTTQTNAILRGDVTYFISANVTLAGSNTTFEGGVVIKSATNVSLTVNTPLTWLATAYRPVVMTARDDNSVGETISGSTGNPTTNYYGNPALKITTSNTQLHHLRVACAEVGVFFHDYSAGNSNVVSHAQFVHCHKAIQMNG